MGPSFFNGSANGPGNTDPSLIGMREARAIFESHCFSCHGVTSPKAGLNLDKLTASASTGENFAEWERVALVLEQKTMPPVGMPQPGDSERAAAIDWIRRTLADYARRHDGDPGRVTVRRLTSGEYGYAVRDLTGIDGIETGIDASTDSAGGEGFTSFGDVQFMQDSGLERYLGAARKIADHAVIGAGPLQFFTDPGKTGLELSAIERIREIYAASGFRTVSGEGGRPFGLEKYGQALHVAWQYRHRARLGKPAVTLNQLATAAGISTVFAAHINEVINRNDLGYPLQEAAARWRRLPEPGIGQSASDTAEKTARKGCEQIQTFLVTWPSWLFARGDVAAGGAGDESPLEFTDRTLNVNPAPKFTFIRGGARGGEYREGPAKIYLNVDPVNPGVTGKPVMIWRNLTIGIRPRPTSLQQPVTPIPAGDQRKTLRSVVTAEMARQLNFGVSPDGTVIGPDDFASVGSTVIEIPVPNDSILDLQFVGELGRDREHVVRVLIADRADGKTRGQPTRVLIGDMKSRAYRNFRDGVTEYVSLAPPNSHAEPTPADKDPIPDPFDNTYNVPEHDAFVTKIKYIRDDRFLVEHLIDAATRRRLDQAWMDLYASFEYHDNYLRLLAAHYKLDLGGDGIARMTPARIATLPAVLQPFVVPLRAHYEQVVAAQAGARSRHVTDCLDFASRAWRRPLTSRERVDLRAFYARTLAEDQDHVRALRALIARVLVAPQFLYRVEPAASVAGAGATRPLSGWELASRLSFFIWASIPDAELRRAAAAGELSAEGGLARQVKRMLADPKGRRLSTEFFGQWLGFYHFDRYRGVDTSRFTEFTDEVRAGMYEEAVSFFEHIIRQDRPVSELFNADYTFLNRRLAEFYGIRREGSGDRIARVDGVAASHRGGLLRLGAVLTVTSAPLRTSPVKRGDWLLRRIIGTPVPPPPANAGSIPADDKLFGGLSLKARLEQHKRNASCASCHTRIDPLGFALERYDPTGRWRESYQDGKSIDDSGETADRKVIAGVDGLLEFIRGRDPQVRRNLSFKLIGYALGRTVLASDRALVDRMVAAGGDAAFSRLIGEIAMSRQFRYRTGNEASPDPREVTRTSRPKQLAQVSQLEKLAQLARLRRNESMQGVK